MPFLRRYLRSTSALDRVEEQIRGLRGVTQLDE